MIPNLPERIKNLISSPRTENNPSSFKIKQKLRSRQLHQELEMQSSPVEYISIFSSLVHESLLKGKKKGKEDQGTHIIHILFTPAGHWCSGMRRHPWQCS
jgi:hypothetical protein